jgi:hypothetical protein
MYVMFIPYSHFTLMSAYNATPKIEPTHTQWYTVLRRIYVSLRTRDTHGKAIKGRISTMHL